MNSLADGGALADAGLAVNILIAIGTIGAASVALWLGIHAQRTSTSQAREARMKLTRQMIYVYRAARDETQSSKIEVINASPEVVTRVVVLPTARTDPNGTPAAQPGWRWDEERSTGDFADINYLLPGQSAVLRGDFSRPRPGIPHDPAKTLSADEMETVSVEPGNVDVELIWEDSYGQVWNKKTHTEAYPTSWAAPWRDLRNYVPPWAYPPHWPPKEPDRRKPPVRLRVQSAGARLKAHLRRSKSGRNTGARL